MVPAEVKKRKKKKERKISIRFCFGEKNSVFNFIF